MADFPTDEKIPNDPAAPRERQGRRRRMKAEREPERIERIAAHHQLLIQREVTGRLGIANPFFLCHERMAKDTALIGGREFLNFSTYDYLDLNGHPAVNAAAEEAMRLYGTSAGASRLVAGERPPHHALEEALAELVGAEAALTYVGGYGANVTVLSHLFSERDLIVHDALSHNSLITGAQASGAMRFSYPHDDLEALDRYLAENRDQYNRAVIVTEGVFSMDGAIASVPGLIELKKRHRCFLMLDEAHSIGILGETGRGAAEHFGLEPGDIDILMGTLSKTLCGCGGFIAGSAALIELLRYTSPGFLYSVGLAPPLAAASKAALELMLAEPRRVARVQQLGRFFLEEAQKRGLDTGRSVGYGVVPIMVGGSLEAGYLTTALHEKLVNVMPIVYPAVEEGEARLRFFISAAHREEQIERALDITAEELPKARARCQKAMDSDELMDFFRKM